MRRRGQFVAVATLFAVAAGLPAPTAAPARAEETPPHAWLYGSWSGGLYPAPTGLTAEACLAQPVVIFTRDIVLRATLTEQVYAQRLVAAVRASNERLDIRFEPASGGAAGAASLLGLPAPAEAGFGCETVDLLHVERRGDNEIAFPGCSDFPNPLVRCPAR